MIPYHIQLLILSLPHIKQSYVGNFEERDSLIKQIEAEIVEYTKEPKDE